MSDSGPQRARRVAKFLGLVDERPKPTWREMLRAFRRTIPFYAVAVLLLATVSLLDGPSWLTLVLIVAPITVWTFLLEQEREDR